MRRNETGRKPPKLPPPPPTLQSKRACFCSYCLSDVLVPVSPVPSQAELLTQWAWAQAPAQVRHPAHVHGLPRAAKTSSGAEASADVASASEGDDTCASAWRGRMPVVVLACNLAATLENRPRLIVAIVGGGDGYARRGWVTLRHWARRQV